MTLGVYETMSKINVFPNPADDYIEFDFNDNSILSTIEIYNLQGKKVLNKKLINNSKVSISHLVSGMYLYRIIQGGNQQTGKLFIL